MIVLDLPVPPSVNATRRIDWRGHQKLKKWREQAGKVMVMHGQHKQPNVSGEFEIDIILSESRKDIDNILKAIVDYCKDLGFFEDDSPKYMRGVSIRFTDVELNAGECRVIISPA